MGARGPHDEFEPARATVEAALEAMNRGDLAAVREYVDEDVEHVTRDGAVRGPERLLGELSTQQGQWTIAYALEELIDAGGGALLVLAEVKRHDRETGELDWRAWPAFAVRIDGGKVVFFEGYVDRRRAIDALGVAV